MATIATASTGCYSTFDLSAQSMRALNGFHEGEHRTIPNAEGQSMVFDRDTTLRFEHSANDVSHPVRAGDVIETAGAT